MQYANQKMDPYVTFMVHLIIVDQHLEMLVGAREDVNLVIMGLDVNIVLEAL